MAAEAKKKSVYWADLDEDDVFDSLFYFAEDAAEPPPRRRAAGRRSPPARRRYQCPASSGAASSGRQPRRASLPRGPGKCMFVWHLSCPGADFEKMLGTKRG